MTCTTKKKSSKILHQKGQSWTLEDQVVLASSITLHILSHGSSDEDVLAEIATAATFPQIVVSSLACLHSGDGLAARINVVEASWSYTVVLSEAGIREVRSICVASGRWEKSGEQLSDDGFDGGERGADYAGVDFDVGPDGCADVVIW